MQCGLKSNTERVKEVRRTLQPLREVWMKVGLEKIDMHEGTTVMTILDSPGLSAIDQQWLDLLWNEEMLTLSSLTHTP